MLRNRFVCIVYIITQRLPIVKVFLCMHKIDVGFILEFGFDSILNHASSIRFDSTNIFQIRFDSIRHHFTKVRFDSIRNEKS